MPYTTEDGGRINNFAHEPKVYQAQAPTENEKRNNLILVAVSTILVLGGIAIAFYASTNAPVA
ncbi:ssl1498 family light-harvesting-like protein [Cyanobacterium stanieri LEGE 03274]|uniref:Ssl1498 family light-harvesting-like protein n=1 Tax=Cyanobacterium stanieri LEGE 03274 TaxID=1828756 RepID=A0ABR9V0R5_9CHRO|nr:ssl1498 family light-harvesting-like protein [Cyanobacterium stanieri]MBE9221465.1 ssl1498 family light-harvesting-like protein [Cyanobacterium stanieri LEGE 03274]